MKELALIEVVRKMAYSGKDYETIIKEIDRKKNRYTEENISHAKRKVDDFIVEYQLANQEKSKALNQILIGLFLFLIGAGITGYTYFSKNSQYVIAYGAILIGAWILKEGYKKYQKPIEELLPRKRMFRK